MEWKNGYVIGIEYVHGVHRELGPSALNLVLSIQGLEPVPLRDGFTYCDLGCGQGDGVNLFAACHPEGEFHAVDFNAEHIAGARSLAARADLENVAFWEANFADLVELPLPAFDFIVIHGVYSWVGADARRSIVTFLRDKLKPGGVVYLSYNSLPGWSVHAPLRQLLCSYADTQSGPLERRIDRAIEFVGRLKTARAAIFEAIPSTGDFFEFIRTLPRNYLAHEFFNRDWALFYHAEVVRELAVANLSFSGPANLAENQDLLRFSEAQQQLFDQVTDPVMRESVKDFVTNTLLRRDLFTKWRPHLDPSLQQEHLGGCRFALVVPQAKLTRTALFPIGEAVLDRELYDPILSALELKPHTLVELLQRQAIGALGVARVSMALMVLLSAEYVMPAVEPTHSLVLRTERLNRALLERGADHMGKFFLASPVLRNAIKVEWLERLLILCELDRPPDPLSWIAREMAEHGYKLGTDGETVVSKEETLAELALRIESLRASRLPQLRQLGIL